MNHGPHAARAFVSELGSVLGGAALSRTHSQLRVALLTPAVTLTETLQAIANTPALSGWVSVGAQNAHFEKSGAFTGELSAPLLHEIGVTLTLVGHSERRQHFGETNESAGRRLCSLLAQGMDVVFCIGETLPQREQGITRSVVLGQLDRAFEVASERSEPWNWAKLTIAYEPVWAIGTGVTATPEQAEEVHALIREWLSSKGHPETPILYGGSVTPENIAGLLACPNVDGGLVGGASLKSASFLKLIEAGAQAI